MGPPIRCLTPRGPNHRINIKILQTMVSGIPLALGLRTRMQDPSVSVVFGVPIFIQGPAL